MAVVAVLVFVAAYILIDTERVPRMVTALVGAGIMSTERPLPLADLEAAVADYTTRVLRRPGTEVPSASDSP